MKEFQGMGYGQLKTAVADTVVAELEPLQKRYYEIRSDKEFLNKVMNEGAERAGRVAYKTISKVYKKIGFGPKKL